MAYLVLDEQDALNLRGNIHFFGTSSLKSMIAFGMLSKNFNTPVTFDSSSYILGARFRKWFQPMSVRHCVDVGRSSITRMDSNPCRCPICRVASIEDLYSQTNKAPAPMLLSLHNLYQFVEVNALINRLIDENELRQYAELNGELKLVRNVDGMFEIYDYRGCQGVSERYKNLLVPKKAIRQDLPFKPIIPATISSTASC